MVFPSQAWPYSHWWPLEAESNWGKALRVAYPVPSSCRTADHNRGPATPIEPEEACCFHCSIAWLCPYASRGRTSRSEEHTSELQSLMRISYAVFCLKKKTTSLQTKKPTKETI